MPLSEKYVATFAAGRCYHVFSQSNGNDTLFSSDEEHRLFLDKMEKHIKPVASLLAYCLMPDHLHLLVRVSDSIESAETAVPEAFRMAFKEFAQKVNFMRERGGNLFRKKFRRIRVPCDSHAMSLAHYLHYNPAHHGLVEDWREWPWSSYHAAIGEDASGPVDVEGLLDLFGGRGRFDSFHEMRGEYRSIDEYLIEPGMKRKRKSPA
jgi:REP element-mobilizing transposase RayT